MPKECAIVETEPAEVTVYVDYYPSSVEHTGVLYSHTYESEASRELLTSLPEDKTVYRISRDELSIVTDIYSYLHTSEDVAELDALLAELSFTAYEETSPSLYAPLSLARYENGLKTLDYSLDLEKCYLHYTSSDGTVMAAHLSQEDCSLICKLMMLNYEKRTVDSGLDFFYVDTREDSACVRISYGEYSVEYTGEELRALLEALHHTSYVYSVLYINRYEYSENFESNCIKIENISDNNSFTEENVIYIDRDGHVFTFEQASEQINVVCEAPSLLYCGINGTAVRFYETDVDFGAILSMLENTLNAQVDENA